MASPIIAELSEIACHNRGRVAGNLYVGTSGFAYDEWRGPFYPPTLKPRQMLSFYASRFRSVEINYTFRREASEQTLAAWRESTPDGFVFALKAHQRITHWGRLAGTNQAITVFLEQARTLEPKLGPILFQCPPNLPFDRGLIESFLAFLPPTFRYAFEFRHPSWVESKETLASQGIAWCMAETGDNPVQAHAIDANPFAYLRLRKQRYSDHELKAWAERIDRARESGSDVYCYFKHEEKGLGPKLAQRMSELVAP